MNTANRFDYLDAVRGFAIVLVVGIHAFAYGIPDDTGAKFFGVFTIQLLMNSAVATFFMIDGFLMARSQNKENPSSFSAIATKSARRLLVPWLVFTCLYLVLRGVCEAAGLFPKHLVLGQGVREIATSVWYSSVSMQLYFLPTLFLMRLTVAPMGKVWRGPIGWSVLVWVASLVLLRFWPFPIESDPISSLVVGYPYFLFGAILYKIESLEWKRLLLGLGVLGAVAIALVYIPSPWMRWAPSLEVAKYGLLVVLYLIAQALGSRPKPLIWLGRHTMEIFLLHAPVLIKIVQMVVQKLTPMPPLRFFAIWVIVLAVTVIVTMILDKIPLSKKLFGEA